MWVGGVETERKNKHGNLGIRGGWLAPWHLRQAVAMRLLLQADSSSALPPPPAAMLSRSLPLYSVLFDSPLAWSLSSAHSIQKIQCCLDKMNLIYKQFKKSRMRPGEPWGEQTTPPPPCSPSPPFLLPSLCLSGCCKPSVWLLQAYCVPPVYCWCRAVSLPLSCLETVRDWGPVPVAL